MNDNKTRLIWFAQGYIGSIFITYICWFIIGLIPWFVTFEIDYLKDVLHYMFNDAESGNFLRIIMLSSLVCAAAYLLVRIMDD